MTILDISGSSIRMGVMDFYGYWPKQTGSPYTEVLNQTPKYVASTTVATYDARVEGAT